MFIFDESGVPSRELFLFLKYNVINQNQDIGLSDSDKLLFDNFKNKITLLQNQLKNDDSAAKLTSNSILSMFGYSRHYCAVTGVPIVGKYYKIGSKIVSKEAYEAHKILQKIEQNDINV